MARTTTRPAETVAEEIRSLEEIPTYDGVTPGIVRALVGRLDAGGSFSVPQQYEIYTIEGAMYDELVGPPQAWNPNKPTGTYSNDDLWHFIDLIRAGAAGA